MKLQEGSLGLDTCQKVLFHIVCLTMLCWYSWNSISHHLSGPTSTTILNEDISKEGNLPEVQVCRKPPFKKDALHRYNFSVDLSYVLGQGKYGWSGNSSSKSPLEVFNELVSARSVKDVIREARIIYRMRRNESKVYYFFNLTTDFKEKWVGQISRSRCFSLNPRPKAGLERPKGIIYLDFNTSNRMAHNYDVEINYPGQFYYHLSELEAKKDLITSEPKKMRIYYVILSLKRFLPNDPRGDCVDYGEMTLPYKSYDECLIAKMKKIMLNRFACVPPLYSSNPDELCTSFQPEWHEFVSDLEMDKANYCKKPCTTMQVNAKLLTEVPSTNKTGTTLTLEIFPDIQVTQSQFSTTPMTVMADLGGYLGLWLGASVLDLSRLVTYVLGKAVK